MKKVITIMGLFGLIFVQAQVGINKDKPDTTLDIVAEKTDGSQVEGLLVPRISKEAAYNMAIAPTKPQESNMVYVNNANYAFPAGTTVAQKATVTDITEKGYYFWNGSKWERITSRSSAEWVYDPVTKQTNLKRSGTAPFTNMVYFDETGRFFNTKGINENVFRGNNYIAPGATTSATNFSGLKNSNSINIDYFEAKDAPTSSTLPNDHVFRQESFFAVDDAAVDKHAYDTFSSGAEYVYTKPGMLKNVHALVGKQTRIANLADVDVLVMSGGRSTVYLKEGKASHIDGYSTLVELSSNKSTELVNGFYSNLTSTKGVHNFLAGFRTKVSVLNTTKANYVSGLVSNPILGGGVVVTNLNGARIVNQFGADVNTVAPQIGTLKGIYVHPHHVLPSTLSPDITHAYGIEIEDVTLGTASNYAIYTKAGKVRLGDDVTIGTTAAPKKLEVSGAIKVGSDSTTPGIPSHAAPAGTIIFHNGSFYGNTDDSSTGWKKLHN